MSGWPPRLGSVKARQKIGAPTFELRRELFGKLKLDFRFATELAERAEQSGQTEWRSVLHHRRLRSVAELFCFRECVLDLAKTVDQFVVQRFFAGKNAPVGDVVAKHVGGQVTLLRHDSEKFVVGFHHETPNQIALFRSRRASTIQNVLKLPAFENDRR